jgi:hypothetical protein
MKPKLITIGTISCLVSCLSVEPKGIDQQQTAFESVYLACANSKIFTKSDIEESINNGGNNLDRACKKSFQLIDISQLSLKIKVNDFREAVDPFKEISDQLLVLNSMDSSKAISNKLIIKIPENSQYSSSDLKVFGK